MLIAYKKGYRVLSDGTFVSPKGVPLKTKVIRGKYRCYTLRISPSESGNVMIHRLCAYQKYGDIIFMADCVRHINGNSLDNSFKNIEIGTSKDNAQDVPKEKRNLIGINASRFSIKWDREAVERYYKLHGYKNTMKHFGISSSSLWRVLHRKTNNVNPNK